MRIDFREPACPAAEACIINVHMCHSSLFVNEWQVVIAFAESLKFRDEVIQEFTTKIDNIATILEELQAKGMVNVVPYRYSTMLTELVHYLASIANFTSHQLCYHSQQGV